MTSKLPWTTAAILIVAAVAVGAWAVWGTAPAPPEPEPGPGPAPDYGTITVVSSNTVFAGSIPGPGHSGIENIYIMRHGFGDEPTDNGENITGENENLLSYGGIKAVITASGDSVNIPQNEPFDIVVTFKVDNDNIVDPTSTDNFYILLKGSGAYTIAENSDSTNMFCIENGSPNQDWGRWNAVFNNGGEGYVLTGGQSISLDNVDLYGWSW